MPGKYVYLRDADDGDTWSATWQPVGKPLDQMSCECRHGTGYTKILSRYRDIETEALYFIPVDADTEVWLVTLRNAGDTFFGATCFPGDNEAGSPHVVGHETDLMNFLGRYGNYRAPRAVHEGRRTSSSCTGDMPCAAFQIDVTLPPGRSASFAVLFGVGPAATAGAAARICIHQQCTSP